jgi:glucose/arabinose dehydrogenase
MTKVPRHLVFAVALLLGLAAAAQAQAAAQQQNPQQGLTIDPQVARPGGDLPGDPQIELELVAEGLVDPVNVASAGDGRLFIVERVGRIRILDESGQLLEQPFLDIQDTVMTRFLEQGLLGLAFHPNYAENGRF